ARMLKRTPIFGNHQSGSCLALPTAMSFEGSSPFDERFPEPLQGAVHHAERFSVALSLAEVDESRAIETGPRELSLSETWIVGRAGEIEAVVRDVVETWRSGALPIKSAAAAIESYVLSLHRGMAEKTCLGEPTCCSNKAT